MKLINNLENYSNVIIISYGTFFFWGLKLFSYVFNNKKMFAVFLVVIIMHLCTNIYSAGDPLLNIFVF